VAVYVDDARIPWRGLIWSHMVAETEEELHGAAEALGIPRTRVQAKGRTVHYDLPEAWRQRAIAAGLAEPIVWRDLVRMRHKLAGASKRASGA
jgi:Protein of unknown function (DUF4031)